MEIHKKMTDMYYHFIQDASNNDHLWNILGMSFLIDKYIFA